MSHIGMLAVVAPVADRWARDDTQDPGPTHRKISSSVAGGKARNAGHRITVQNIVIWHDRLGLTADEIASDHGLSLADVHAALAYYFDNRVEMDRAIAEDEAFVEQVRASTPSRLKDKLRGG